MAQAQLEIARKLMAALPRIEPPKSRSISVAERTRRLNDRIGERPAPDLNLVQTAASVVDDPISLEEAFDQAFDAMDEYRAASTFAHRSPEPRPPEPKPKPTLTSKPEPKPQIKRDGPTKPGRR